MERISKNISACENILIKEEPLNRSDVASIQRLPGLEVKLDTVDPSEVHKIEEKVYIKFVVDISKGSYKICDLMDIAAAIRGITRLNYQRSY